MAKLRQTYLRTQKLAFGAVLPFIILGCVFARPFILVWAGSQYENAALVMQWLLLAALSQALAYPSDLLLYACGEVKQAAKISVVSSAISILAALLLISRFGVAGFAAGMAVTQLVFNCGWFTWAACRISGTSPAALFRALFDGLLIPLAALGLGIIVARGVWSHLSALGLIIFGGAAGLVYLAFWGLRTALPLYRGYTEAVAQ